MRENGEVDSKGWRWGGLGEWSQGSQRRAVVLHSFSEQSPQGPFWAPPAPGDGSELP